MSTSTLELNAPRIVALQSGTKNFVLTTRRATQEDWFAFFDAITISTVRDGKDSVIANDFESPALLIADRLLTDATGYTTDTGAALPTLENWPSLLPFGHRMALGKILSSTRVLPVDSEEGVISTNGHRVEVSTTWTANEAQDGMLQISGLVHTLATPTEKQHRRFAREDSMTRILGGSRVGTTVYPYPHRILAELYDELVVSVEGYTHNGKLLVGRETIAAEMDTHHKVMVAQAIFKPNDTVISKLDVQKPVETTED